MFLVPLTRQANELGRPFDRLFDDHLFDRFFAPVGRPDANVARSPALDVAESERAYTVKLEMPGVTKDDVKIAVDGRRVTVEAASTQDAEKKEGDRVVYRERSVASYARSFTLPAEVDQAESTARMEHGVLTLTLAKRGTGKATRITVS
ncbi:Hsp20/alpha crystallin family protein [Ideonella sp. A 288]|uniref:Hsp20/alpha crystallin family protein n=1 Tax=Ideonella sp. A 288 TaxID=1962181 RepID=UPI000B4A589D|nr:Hsp20/alpha crystallin family protein [Ideonella sp. A 288]